MSFYGTLLCKIENEEGGKSTREVLVFIQGTLKKEEEPLANTGSVLLSFVYIALLLPHAPVPVPARPLRHQVPVRVPLSGEELRAFREEENRKRRLEAEEEEQRRNTAAMEKEQVVLMDVELCMYP